MTAFTLFELGLNTDRESSLWMEHQLSWNFPTCNESNPLNCANNSNGQVEPDSNPCLTEISRRISVVAKASMTDKRVSHKLSCSSRRGRRCTVVGTECGEIVFLEDQLVYGLVGRVKLDSHVGGGLGSMVPRCTNRKWLC